MKYESIIHNNSSSSEKVHLLLSLIKIQPCISLELFCLVNAADFAPDSDQNTFSLEEELLWIIDSYFLMLDLFQMLSSPDVN